MPKIQQRESVSRSATLTIPELEQSKAALLNTLASPHSRRSYEYAIERFIAWYCDEPRLAFNRSVVVRYRSFLESLSLSAATINLHEGEPLGHRRFGWQGRTATNGTSAGVVQGAFGCLAP